MFALPCLKHQVKMVLSKGKVIPDIPKKKNNCPA